MCRAFFTSSRNPLTAAVMACLPSAAAVARKDEAQAKKQFGMPHWIDDPPWLQANERVDCLYEPGK